MRRSELAAYSRPILFFSFVKFQIFVATHSPQAMKPNVSLWTSALGGRWTHGLPDRLAVLSTRANYCTIYVDRVTNPTKSAHLQRLVELHRNSALFQVHKDMEQFCTKCSSFGHKRDKCEAQLPCRSCKGKAEGTPAGTVVTPPRQHHP